MMQPTWAAVHSLIASTHDVTTLQDLASRVQVGPSSVKLGQQQLSVVVQVALQALQLNEAAAPENQLPPSESAADGGCCILPLV